jgi:predicted acetyltransferase
VAPTISVRALTPGTRPVLERLWQLYRHDLSEFRGSLPAADGTFHTRTLRPFLADDPDRSAHLFQADGSLVGFGLVSRVTTEPHLVSEFFVVRGVRGQGVARVAARELLALHPGAWEIPFQEDNVAAARFWRRLAAAVAADGVREDRRPVPGKPHIPPDVWLALTVAASADQAATVSQPSSRSAR